MRPCTCDKLDCPPCKLYRTSVRHRHFWDTGEEAVCDHLGEPILSGEVARLELPLLRIWRPCGLGHGAKGYVCECEQTCVMCKDFAVNGERD